MLDSEDIDRFIYGEIALVSSESDCNLNDQACNATLPDGMKIRMDITPKPIIPMHKLTFTVWSEEAGSDTIDLHIHGTNMDMGIYRYTLEKTPDGFFTGHGIVPSCVGKMEWAAELHLQQNNKRIGVRYDFFTP